MDSDPGRHVDPKEALALHFPVVLAMPCDQFSVRAVVHAFGVNAH
jgi:hypothetical protein